MNENDAIEDLITNSPKTWSDKVDNYQKIIDLIKDNVSVNYLDNNPHLLKLILNEYNANALEKGLEMILAYFEVSLQGQKNMKSESLVFIDKCFKQNKQNIKNIGIDILILLSKNFTSELIEVLLSNLSNNKPSIVNGVLETLIKMIKLVKNFPVKDVGKNISIVLDSRDKLSRDLAKQLCIEICRVFGRSRIEPHLKNLKPIMISELQLEFDKIVPNTVCNESDIEDSKPTIDLLSKISVDFFTEIDGTRQNRKEALETLLGLMDDSHLQNGNYRKLIRKLCEIMTKDSQIQSVILSVSILHKIAVGLRKDFSPYGTIVIESCLEKFKEKKLSVLSLTRDCIDASFKSICFDNCSDIIFRAFEQKNPSVRQETVGFLLRVIRGPQGGNSLKKHWRPLMECLKKLCDDIDSKVRELTFQLIGELIAHIGMREFKSFLDQLETTKANLIRAAIPRINEPMEKNSAPEPPKLIVAKEPVKKIHSAPVVTKPMKEFVFSEQDLQDRYLQLFGKDVLDKLASQVWKNRMEACDKVSSYVAKQDIDRTICQVVTQFVIQKPGLRDSNIMVVKKKLQILQNVFAKCETNISILIAEICIGEIVDKIGDVKIGFVAKETVLVLCSQMGENSQLIVRCLHCLVESKSIRAVTENLVWITEYLSNHGSKSLPIKDILPLSQQLLSSSNSTVKQSSITLIGVLYMIHGKQVVHYFESEKPVVVEMIMKEVNKIDKILKEKKLKPQEITKIPDAEIKTHFQTNETDNENLATSFDDKENIPMKKLDLSPQSQHVSNVSLDDYQSFTDDNELEIKDNCRSFVLDMCDKLNFYTNQHSSRLFLDELGSFFSSMIGICDADQKSSISLLLTALQNNWIEKDSVSTQTGPEENLPENNQENLFLGEFINTRKHRRGNHRNPSNQENIIPLSVLEPINDDNGTLYHSRQGNKEDQQISTIKEIISGLQHESIDFVQKDNLSRLKNLLKDSSRIQIRDYIPTLISRLVSRVSDLRKVALTISILEMQQIVIIISTIFIEPEFVQVISESQVSELCHQLFITLVYEDFQSMELFVGLRKSLSSLILQVTDTVPTSMALCSLLNLLFQSFDLLTYKSNYISALIKSSFKILEKIRSSPDDKIDLIQIMVILNRPFVLYWNDEVKVNSVIFKAFKTTVDFFTKLKRLQLLEYLPENENSQLASYIYRCFHRINGQ